ncbi:hypothetical protein DTW90_27215 [Neorhizobium sp. P12A]|nr:hypothetical protein DTW90_27215 [Neorhizobium sp. P12A]
MYQAHAVYSESSLGEKRIFGRYRLIIDLMIGRRITRSVHGSPPSAAADDKGRNEARAGLSRLG